MTKIETEQESWTCRIVDDEKLSERDVTGILSRLQEVWENNAYILKVARLAVQMTKRQLKSGTEEHDQHVEMLADIDKKIDSQTKLAVLYEEMNACRQPKGTGGNSSATSGP